MEVVDDILVASETVDFDSALTRLDDLEDKVSRLLTVLLQDRSASVQDQVDFLAELIEKTGSLPSRFSGYSELEDRAVHRLRWLRQLRAHFGFIVEKLKACRNEPDCSVFTPPLLQQAPRRGDYNRARELATHLGLAKNSVNSEFGGWTAARVGELAFESENRVIEYCLAHGEQAIPGPDVAVQPDFAGLHCRFWQDYQVDGVTSADLPASYYKRFFDKFFEDDLYGRFKSDDNIILSTGSLHQDEFPLSTALKYCIDFALDRNWVGYSHSLGRLSARQPIADLENARLQRPYFTREHVALITGATAGISNLLRFLIARRAQPDAEILTHLPNYVPFIAACEQIANTRYVDCSQDPDFQLKAHTVMAHSTSKTAIILLVTDLNPVGRPMPVEELQELAEFCDRRQIYLLIDEAGNRYPSERRLTNYSCLRYVIRLDSLSKKCGIPGMKLGYFVADPRLVRDYYEYASTHYGGPASFFYLLQEFEARFDAYMHSRVYSLSLDHLQEFDSSYDLNLPWLQLLYDEYRGTRLYNEEKIRWHRDYAVRTLQRHVPNLIAEVLAPQNGINVFCRINYPAESYIFFRRLLDKKHVAVFPGVCSGKADGCWVRITASVERETLEDGLARLIAFMKEAFVEHWCANNQVFHQALLVLGRYQMYPDLDFSAHVYDVYEKASWLAKSVIPDFADRVDADLLRDAALCHDAGKVLSVLAGRIWRLLRLQARYPHSVPAHVLATWTDAELLGYRDTLAAGTPLELQEMLARYPAMQPFHRLVEWHESCPPRDWTLTTHILSMATLGLEKAAAEHWERVRQVVGRRAVEIDPTSNLDSIDLHALLIDIADRLADANLHDNITGPELMNCLESKRQYAMWRYVKRDELLLADTALAVEAIEEEFRWATSALLRCFNIDATHERNVC